MARSSSSRPTTFQALTGEPVRTSPVGCRRRSRDGPHRTGALGHPHRGRAGQRRFHRAPGARPGQRPARARLCLATDAPITLAPAMNRVMWANAATAGQRRRCCASAASDPRARPRAPRPAAKSAPAACSKPQEIVAALAALEPAPCRALLAGKRVLVTAGPTYEDLDPVRYLGNRSSGKMGFALAARGRRDGRAGRAGGRPGRLADARRRAPHRRAPRRADARCGARRAARARTSSSPPPPWPTTCRRTTQPQQDQEVARGTLDTGTGATPDVLREVAAHAQRPALVVGFAAETEDVEANAPGQARGKGARPDRRQRRRRARPRLRAATKTH